MKIVIITGSHRPGSNSGILADHFQKGVEEAGHNIFRFDAAHKTIHGCIGCDRCHMNGPCIFDDDFTPLREPLVAADMVLFASPMYYFGMSSQIRSVIDRFYAIDQRIMGGKGAALVATFWTTDLGKASGIVESYKNMLAYLHWIDRGILLAGGVNAEKEVLRTAYPQQIYEFAKTL
ncbi:MAG: flavodoxin family protein [Desulfovibrio sp.]|nr:flavodoxin family protein [Desulfovibrio sp.]